MIIAEQKKKENITEYLIYMYQIEDLIRAYGLDITKIEDSVVNQFKVSYEVRRDMLEWYRMLITRMKEENKEKAGHLDFLNRIADRLNKLHQNLVSSTSETEYISSYNRARSNIEALRERGSNKDDHDIQVILNGLYGLLILKIQKIEISEETMDAFNTISEMMALLAVKFMESGE